MCRLLRGTKNRFGSTDEVGVFKMAQEGLVAVNDPSGFLLEDRDGNASPTPVAVAALLEGTRPILVEIQVGVAWKIRCVSKLLFPHHSGLHERQRILYVIQVRFMDLVHTRTWFRH